MKHLIDVLACPCCRADLRPSAGGLDCTGCGRSYPVEDGVPVLLPDPGAPAVVHEDELELREGYVAYLEEVLAALPRDRVVLDIGSGNRRVADERVVRMDVARTSFVDVVADAHALPFKDGSVGFLHASSVFEHLRRPWEAAEDMCRALAPGANVFVDCAFVFPFHGYPATYFNASTDGMRELFRELEEIAVGVAPWTMPSYAVERLLGEYVRFFPAESEVEREFVAAVQSLARFPLREFDRRFRQEDAARIAACVFFCGLKRDPERSSLPPLLRELYASDPELQRRFPQPLNVMGQVVEGRSDSLFAWARGEGAADRPELRGALEELPPFSRRLVP